MKSTKYLLIGGGLSCTTAAKRLRELDASAGIMLVSQESHLPYDHPPLTKDFMLGKTPLDKVFLNPPDFYAGSGIETIIGERVEGLDMTRHIATLGRGESIQFEKVLLGTGGRPVRLGIDGEDLPGVLHFRTLDDAVEVSRHISPDCCVVIVGGGFIGMELASSLTQRDMNVQLVQKPPQIWSRFADESLSKYFQDYCTARGVTFHLGRTVASLQGDGHVKTAILDDGQSITCDMVIIAVGIEPCVELAQQAHLDVDNGVVVDAHMRTSHPDVYAAGDIANYPDPHFGIRRRVEHWGQAEYTGTLAADNLAGGHRTYDLLTYVWSDIFDLHLEFAGDERQYERVITRGCREDNRFAAFYLRGGRMTAFFAVNQKRAQFKPYGKLIEQKVDLTGQDDLLRDEKFDLNELLTVRPQFQSGGTKAT